MPRRYLLDVRTPVRPRSGVGDIEGDGADWVCHKNSLLLPFEMPTAKLP
jgi:hypothetical protein